MIAQTNALVKTWRWLRPVSCNFALSTIASLSKSMTKQNILVSFLCLIWSSLTNCSTCEIIRSCFKSYLSRNMLKCKGKHHCIQCLDWKKLEIVKESTSNMVWLIKSWSKMDEKTVSTSVSTIVLLWPVSYWSCDASNPNVTKYNCAKWNLF